MVAEVIAERGVPGVIVGAQQGIESPEFLVAGTDAAGTDLTEGGRSWVILGARTFEHCWHTWPALGQTILEWNPD